jgi:hypothetical protein
LAKRRPSRAWVQCAEPWGSPSEPPFVPAGRRLRPGDDTHHHKLAESSGAGHDIEVHAQHERLALYGQAVIEQTLRLDAEHGAKDV